MYFFYLKVITLINEIKMAQKSAYKALKPQIISFLLTVAAMAWVTVSTFGFILLLGSISAVKRPRIVGGSDAEIEEYPYLVSLRVFGEDFCGGTIISHRHILTAAHCLDAFRKELIKVHSGTSRSNDKGNVHNILSVHIHPKWGSNDGEEEFSNDIAVLTLEHPIYFDEHQQKINLPSQDVQNYQGGYLLGWGRTTNSNRQHPQQLQKLRVALLKSDTCKSYVSAKINHKQLCAYSYVNSGLCYGDGGGPLVSHGEVVGIASFIDDEECASGVNDVYTNVFAYKDFIERIVYYNE